MDWEFITCRSDVCVAQQTEYECTAKPHNKQEHESVQLLPSTLCTYNQKRFHVSYW